MAIKNRINRRRIKWTLGILIVLLVLIGGGIIYLGAKWKPLLSDKLHASVFQASQGLYQIQFKNIHLNPLTGNLVLDTVSLRPDTSAYRRLSQGGKLPMHVFRVSLKYLKISRFSLWSAYFNQRIRVNTIVLENPVIDMVKSAPPFKKRNQNIEEKTLYQLLSKSFRSIRINGIRIVNADFDYYNRAEKIQSVKHFNADFKDFLVDSLSQTDKKRVLYCRSIGFAIGNYTTVTKDKMYTIKVDSVMGSLTQKKMVVKGAKVIPMHAELPFSRKYAVQKDRYHLSFENIGFEDVDFLRLNASGDLQMRKLTIGPARIAVFMNRELPPPNFDKARNFPIAALKRAPMGISIDTVHVAQVDVAYTEYNPQSGEKGTVHLKKLSGNVVNVSNDSLLLAKKRHAYANLTAYIMERGKMDVAIDFDLGAKDLAFSYQGKIGSFDLKILNPLAKPLGLVAIESGKVEAATFLVKANQYGAKGTVKFLYNDLKIQLLAPKNGQPEKKGVLSFLANTLLVKNNNPDKGGAARVAQIVHRRESQASFFNLMWKSVFVGIRENVGLGMVPMKKMAKPKTH